MIDLHSGTGLTNKVKVHRGPSPPPGYRFIQRMVYLCGQGNGRDHGLRIADVRDIEPCARIARTAFKYDRFHTDPKFPDKEAGELKVRWIERNILEDTVWVLGDPPMGFISIKDGIRVSDPLSHLKDGDPLPVPRHACIDLIAVDLEFQRMGFGRKLIEQALIRHPNINVGTQEKNPALRLYEDLDFEVVRTEDIYHE